MTMYKKMRTIGQGGFGVVDEVQNARGERFARKTFEPAHYIPANQYDKLRKRFKREVMTQAELGGNEIMPVLAMALDGDKPWFVMPLAEKTYEEQIASDRCSGSVDIDAVADILNGLQYLHDLGYVHRDLNPKNILFHNGVWKLSDLGAVLPPTGQTVTLTEGTVIYTEKYCSPEQRRDFHAAQPAADIYSFGCILHDIYGNTDRTPYSKHTAPGVIGVVIEKCTELVPAKRPNVRVLREIAIDSLVELGGHCRVEDQESEYWLDELSKMDDWDEDKFDQFARFFSHLDVEERSSGHESDWVYSLSTPFLTRVTSDALQRIVERDDGVAAAIIEKYCEWAKTTAFAFHFSDTACARIATIFDHGNPAAKAAALATLVRLGASHNRWHIMRSMLRRCGSNGLTKELAKRLSIEIKTEELDREFRYCVNEVDWDKGLLATELANLAG